MRVMATWYKLLWYKTRLKINLRGMPHLAAGLELELQAKNIAPEKATIVK